MKRKLVERELTSEGPVDRPTTHSTAGGTRRSATVNLRESPLAWLYARGHVDERQFRAGELLRSDYERARLAPGITMRWDPVRARTTGSAGLSEYERQLAAKQRFDGAIAAAGSGLDAVLWRVVCAGDAIATTEKTLGWPARSGKLVLTFALDRVADFYRVAPASEG